MADQKLTALTALAAFPADPANLLLYVVDLTEPLENDQSKKATLALVDTRYQPLDADLTTIAGLAKADGNFIVADGAAWTVESGATARASLGLGSLAVGNSPLPIANGGSGQVTQQAAIDALTNVAAATNEHVLTKDTVTGNAVFKASAGGSSLPVADTQTIVKGSVTDTKLLRFEVDGFTAATTRVITPPDADITLAGQNYANVFTAVQTINTAVISLTTTSTGAEPLYAKRTLITDVARTVATIELNKTAGVMGTGLAAGIDLVTSDAGDNELISIRNRHTGVADSNVFEIIYNANTMLSVARQSGQPTLAVGGTADTQAAYTGIVNLGGAGSTRRVLVLSRNCTAAVTDNTGGQIVLQAETSTTVDTNLAAITYTWATATHATRKGRVVYGVFDTAEREAIRIEASGTAAMVGFLGAAAIVRQAHIADPAGGGTVDAEGRAAINSILNVLENFGFVAAS